MLDNFFIYMAVYCIEVDGFVQPNRRSHFPVGGLFLAQYVDNGLILIYEQVFPKVSEAIFFNEGIPLFILSSIFQGTTLKKYIRSCVARSLTYLPSILIPERSISLNISALLLPFVSISVACNVSDLQ